MAELYKWVLENKESIIQGVTAIIAGAAVIAAVTPTPKDNKFLVWARAVLDVFALNVRNAKNKDQ